MCRRDRASGAFNVSALRRKVDNVPQPPSQQAAADAVYHQYLQSKTPEQMDFVRNDDQWPVIRSSTNKTAKKYGMPRKKGDWHTQRSRFIKQVFLTMYADSESDEDTLLDLMFNGGKYDWLKDTARVIRAVQASVWKSQRGPLVSFFLSYSSWFPGG